eukprot:CAMPEP_0181300340 /NCGR_PEP_ID=MMETSP1101-20121128/6836_1 /TAXON_ID=46948 /ORGANISM="Rhodomonas abbreviata, Strain Caron Lab Isolate" /LENGTH=344 /DNA_ID=CAMNT_0023405567 /DNA_START=3 /DNA_END=1034 /DNA_ORIENTATION=+
MAHAMPAQEELSSNPDTFSPDYLFSSIRPFHCNRGELGQYGAVQDRGGSFSSVRVRAALACSVVAVTALACVVFGADTLNPHPASLEQLSNIYLRGSPAVVSSIESPTVQPTSFIGESPSVNKLEDTNALWVHAAGQLVPVSVATSYGNLLPVRSFHLLKTPETEAVPPALFPMHPVETPELEPEDVETRDLQPAAIEPCEYGLNGEEAMAPEEPQVFMISPPAQPSPLAQMIPEAQIQNAVPLPPNSFMQPLSAAKLPAEEEGMRTWQPLHRIASPFDEARLEAWLEEHDPEAEQEMREKEIEEEEKKQHAVQSSAAARFGAAYGASFAAAYAAAAKGRGEEG